MSIRSFVAPGVFDPEALAAMDEAFDAAFNALDDMGQPKIVLEIIAQRIMEAASQGERDSVRLVKAALPWLTPNKCGGASQPRQCVLVGVPA